MANKITAGLKSVWSALKYIVELIFSILLTAFLIPLALTLYLLNEFVRRAVITPLLKRCTGGKVRLVSDGADNIFSYKKYGNSRNILILTVYKDVIDPEIYGQRFVSKVLNYVAKRGDKPFEKLKKIYTSQFGYNCWRDADNFDIRNHIRVIDADRGLGLDLIDGDGNQNGHFNSNGNGIPSCNKPTSCIVAEPQDISSPSSSTSPITVVTESGLMKILGQLTEDMSEDSPQWEEVIIKNFVYDHELYDQNDTQKMKLKPGSKIRSARIFRCHHSFMDGCSFLLMTSSCMTDGQFPYSADPLAPNRMSKWAQFKLFVKCVVFGFTTILKTMIVAAKVQNRFVTRDFSGKAHHTWSPPISFDIFKDVKRVSEATIPVILSTVTAEAIIKLNERFPQKSLKCADPKPEPKKSDKLLLGMIGAVAPYPSFPINRYTVVNFNVPIGPITRLQRLEKLKKKMKKLGKNQDFLVNLWMLQYFGKFPASIVQALMKNAGSPVVVSNTPWAKSRVSLLGDEVEELGGWIPLLAFSGFGLLITRYCNTIRFCGVSEDACLSREELDFLIAEIHSQILLLAQDAISQKSSNGSKLSISV